MNTNQNEYKEICLSRQRGEYITIGTSNGKVTSFHEEYPGMGCGSIKGYNGLNTEHVIAQLQDCGWRLL